ncbi:hypothetical protein AAP_01966 [Ascosphaera apis ARSEF 7405]|uniref:Uncharacterized protein n=1 Tax=Ascosphaera apis ARSEF 7405 TaxID=392613 RepID=A0A168B1K3_9EURO|nr:hypothetical protein AAP_01966 [Ascosphaera apis ARSEF 7405]
MSNQSPSHSRSPSSSTNLSQPPSHPHPTFIEIPAPPSGTVTPSDMGPSTPNSTTTSLSGLSTIAMKDGHRGTNPSTGATATGSSSSTRRGLIHFGLPATSSSALDGSATLDALRADRISRLAGLERVGVAPPHPNSGVTSSYHGPSSSTVSNYSPSTATGADARGVGGNAAGGAGAGIGFSHFDPWGNPTPSMQKERSTVGSASATGSVGARTTTWMSASQDGDSVSVSDNDNYNYNDMICTCPDAEELADSQRMGVGMPQDSETANMLPPGGIWDGRVAGSGSRRQHQQHDDLQSDVGVDDDDEQIEENDDQASLVGFGEGANSTVSGPISTLAALARSNRAAQAAQAGIGAGAGSTRPGSTSNSTSLPMHPGAPLAYPQFQQQGQVQHAPSASQSIVASDTSVGALSPTGNTAAAPGAIPPSPLSSSSNVVGGNGNNGVGRE